MKFILSLLSILLLIGASNAGLCLKPSTVTELDAAAYLGLWYQVAADWVTMLSFEKGGVCITATYGLIPENATVTVHNSMRIDDPENGTVADIYGYAIIPDESEPGKLQVYLDGVSHGAPYWVLALGPFDSDNLYSWAVVSDPLCSFLFVLSRTPTLDSATYTEIQNLVFSLGWKESEWVDTLQEGCVY